MSTTREQDRIRELEAALVRTEERALAAARAAGFTIWDWDLNDGKVTWGQGVEGLLGYAGSSLPRLTAWLEHVHPGDRDRVSTAMHEMIAGARSRWSDTFRWLRRDGTHAGVFGRAWIVHDVQGNPQRVVGGLIDVTEQKRLERQLEEQVQLTRTVAENAASCLFVLDERGCPTYMNPAAVQTTGYTLEELADTPLSEVMHRHYPGGGDCPVLKRNVRAREHRCELVRKDGTCIPVMCSLSPIGERAVLDFRDISELQKKEHDLQQAVTARDDFLAIAGHELRTPLTSLQLQVQGLVRGPHAEGVDPMVRKRLLEAERSIVRLGKLVEDLLDISRITAGRFSVEPEETDLVAVVKEVAERLHLERERSGSELSMDLPEHVIGKWDRTRLQQVVSNLLTNAFKYGEGNPIAVQLVLAGETAKLTIHDHGMGIAPEDLERVFGRFERAVSGRHFGGFGLGLWITRQVLDAMGGSIRAVSELGKGATFVVELPLAAERRSA